MAKITMAKTRKPKARLGTINRALRVRAKKSDSYDLIEFSPPTSSQQALVLQEAREVLEEGRVLREGLEVLRLRIQDSNERIRNKLNDYIDAGGEVSLPGE